MRLARSTFAFVVACVVFVLSCSNGNNAASIRNADGQISLPTTARSPDGRSHSMIGKASYYADRFEGRKTASGELYDPSLLTAAHRTLPFGTMVRVIDLDNNRSVVVKINDRGPYGKSKVIDISRVAAEDLDMIRRGTLRVHLDVLEWSPE